MPDILAMVNKATELVDAGLQIYDQLKGEVVDSKGAIEDTTLEQAKQRLESSLHRAQAAHDALNAAIDAQLSK